MKNTLPLFCILITLVSTIALVNASTLNLVVTTNKQTYNRSEAIQISGLLALDGVPIANGLVAIQVVEPDGGKQAIRTLNTGQNPQSTPLAEVRNVFLSDGNEHPISTILKGTIADFLITLTNNDVVPKSILATVNIYDSNNVVLDATAITWEVPARDTINLTISCSIPTDGATGTAIVFANAYTAWPSHGGTPLCPEKSATFNIISSGGSPPPTPTGNQGTYNLDYKIPKTSDIGTYTVYATSKNGDLPASNSVTFSVVQQGDFDHDGDVDSNDTASYVRAYIDYWSQNPNYNHNADFDHDGDVDGNDTAAYVRAYIAYWSG
jgi:hypothetical protein